MTPDLTIVQRSAILTGIHSALGTPLTGASAKQLKIAVYAEIIAFADDVPGTLLLAEAVDYAIRKRTETAFTIDAGALVETHGYSMTRRSLLLAGVSPVESGTNVIWTIGGAGKNDPVLVLDSDLLGNWMKDA